jgi:predicted Zn finger-like uncharacterized protein
MKISCPQCRTVYDVEAGSLGPDGRSVRCARCQTVWFASRPAAQAAVIPFPSHDARAAPLQGVTRGETHRSRAAGGWAGPNAAAAGLPPGFTIVPAGQGAAPAAAAAQAAAGQAFLADVAAAPAIAETVVAPSIAPELEAHTIVAVDAPPEVEPEPVAVAAVPEPAPAADASGIFPPDGIIPANERTAEEPHKAAGAEASAATESPDGDAAASENAPAQGVDVESIARRRRAASGTRRPTRKRAEPKWRISLMSVAILILATINGSLLVWRADVVRTLPQTASLYRHLGLPVNLRHLAFTGIRATETRRDGVTILSLEGSIRANGAKVVDVPRLRFAIQAANGHEIYAWTVLPKRTRLARGEVLPFHTRLASPPKQGRFIQVRFFNKQDMAAGMR